MTVLTPEDAKKLQLLILTFINRANENDIKELQRLYLALNPTKDYVVTWGGEN